MDGAASNAKGSRDDSDASDPGAQGMTDVADRNFRSNDPDETQAYLGLRIDRDLLCREIAGRRRGRGKPLLLKSVEFHIDADPKTFDGAAKTTMSLFGPWPQPEP